MDSHVRARSAPSHKQRLDVDCEPLVELLWQGGAVVAQATDTQRRSVGGGGDPGASGVTGEENEAAAWLIPDGGGDRDLYYSQLWHSIADADADAGAGAGAGTLFAGSGEAGSSFCGSNAVTVPALRADDDAAPPPAHPLPQPEEDEPAASSAGGHALSKRSRDELDSRSEDADYEARPSRRPAAKRRTRVAEVHNQSERRRRGRINEKMKSLQELVPHCNKTDKASILDEAIEYLKSLQLQVQIMWMTTGMAPMMFTGAHQLMPPMAMGLNSMCMPAAQSLSQLQRVPPCMNNTLPNQMPQGQPVAISSPNVANQMGNNGVFEPKNPFLHPDSTPPTAAAQVPGSFPYGSQTAQRKEIHEVMASTATPASGPRRPSSSDRTGR